ncbi:bifunctional nicotinamidase/pyrazinamidase [Apibacter sp. HY039]|uniref:bifunctional nicotinamidase/pyrazinamidase n=1 Tax=Apibacter sp. HY039 TaxID=2501476 RepID=UPI000FEBA1F0|nr:bifunctional nicotinamidase/pyrazinamidase [Apibacter sp. HY039]
MKALIIVDVQNDFIPGGNLAVPDGNHIIPIINKIQQNYELVVATQDWHPANHLSFSTMHEGKKNFEQIELDGLPQTLWPAHCVQGSMGAEFSKELNQNKIEAIFRKGMDKGIDSYSGFFDNGNKKSTGLSNYLQGKKVDEVYICGLAADFCVYFTAKDSIKLGFKTFIIDNATKPISCENYELIKREFISLGGEIVNSN